MHVQPDFGITDQLETLECNIRNCDSNLDDNCFQRAVRPSESLLSLVSSRYAVFLMSSSLQFCWSPNCSA